MDGPSIHQALRERGIRAPMPFRSALPHVPLPDDDRISIIDMPVKSGIIASDVRHPIDRWGLVRQTGT